MKTRTQPKLHPCWQTLDYFAVSARLRREMIAAGHTEHATERAQEELIASTATWHHFQSPRDDARFADGIDVLIGTLVWSGGQLGIRSKRREIPEEFAGSDLCDAAAYRLSQWLGVLDRKARDASDRQLRERLRHEMRRDARPTFDVLWSQLAVKKDLSVEDVVNLIVELEPTGEFPFESQEIGGLTYIDLKYRRVLVLPTAFTPTLKRLYPFEAKDSKILKKVNGAPRGVVDVFSLRVLSEFAIDEATIERLAKRLLPWDWTSGSICKSLAEIAAEDAAAGERVTKKADPVPCDVNDLLQTKALAAIESGAQPEENDITPVKVFSGKQLLPRQSSVIVDAEYALGIATADEMFAKPTAVPINSEDQKPRVERGSSCDLSFRQEKRGQPLRDIKNPLEQDEVEEGGGDETD